MSRIVIGIAGPIGAGKTIAARRILDQHSARLYTPGRYFKNWMKQLGIQPTREASNALTDEFRARYGAAYLGQLLVHEARHDTSDLIVFDGIRWVGTHLYLLKYVVGYRLLFVSAPMYKRYLRLRLRSTYKDLSLDKNRFLAQELMSGERETPRLAYWTRYQIKNIGSMESFYIELDAIMAQWLHDTQL